MAGPDPARGDIGIERVDRTSGVPGIAKGLLIVRDNLTELIERLG